MHLFSEAASVKRYAGVDDVPPTRPCVSAPIARKAHQLAELELIVSKVSARARLHRRRCRHAALWARPRLSWRPLLEESAYPTFGDDGLPAQHAPVSSLTI
jgi:hypothetical protein